MSIRDDDKEDMYKSLLPENYLEDNPFSPNHYARFAIEPLDFIAKNNLNFLQGNIIKYVVRFDAKNGVEDLKKARVYLDKLIEQEEAKNAKN